MAKACAGCKYWRYLYEGKACHYAYDNAIAGNVGVTRDCPADSCDKYVSGKYKAIKPKSLKINNNGGKKKMPKTKYSAETISKILDMHANGKSYGIISKTLGIPQSTVGKIVFENKKEEPATAATVTSPVNEKILNESISPEDENVKPDERTESSGDVPEAVKDAVHNEISRIETAIEKTMEIITRLTAEADKLSAKKTALLKWGEENA